MELKDDPQVQLAQKVAAIVVIAVVVAFIVAGAVKTIQVLIF